MYVDPNEQATLAYGTAGTAVSAGQAVLKPAEPRIMEQTLTTVESINTTLEQTLKSLQSTADRLLGEGAQPGEAAANVRESRAGISGHTLDRLDSAARLAVNVLLAAQALERRL